MALFHTSSSLGIRPAFPRLNTGSPHARELTGWWVVVPGVGWVDASLGSRFAGTLTNGATIVSAPQGHGGWTGDFDGTDDYVSIADTPSLRIASTDDFTLSIWCRIDNTVGWRGIVTKSRDSGLYWGVWVSNTSKYNAPGGYYSTTSVTTGVHHVVLRQIGSGARQFFIDGVIDATAGSAVTADGTGIMRIGTAYTGAAYEPFDGQIWDVRLYRRALTDNECWSLYSAATRWDLYAQPLRQFVNMAAAAVGGGAGLRRPWRMGLMGVQ